MEYFRFSKLHRINMPGFGFIDPPTYMNVCETQLKIDLKRIFIKYDNLNSSIMKNHLKKTFMRNTLKRLFILNYNLKIIFIKIKI